jgi:hypothetical protein
VVHCGHINPPLGIANQHENNKKNIHFTLGRIVFSSSRTTVYGREGIGKATDPMAGFKNCI